ncbi:MAG: phosphate/phosphite/phosphonate ABC transporter substrate-binding protein [Leptolyngbya sp. SIOISBB]|nr:phosphate/phosphite/phosphonate ABC transporter substrate-binding protein [Leptolyngbya sp. SIOISBB]
MKRLQRLGILSIFGLCLALLVNLGGCHDPSATSGGPSRLVVGLVSYDTGAASVEAYAPLQDYLGEALKAQVELEPVFNELRAVEQIQSQAWDLAFAPAGLAAIAVDDAQYVPLFPLQGSPQQRSVLVVPTDSTAEALSDLANEVIALGEPGSATGYYLPLYDLYGLTLGEIRFAPTPKTVLEWVAAGEVAAGAISEEGFQQYRNEFPADTFRVLHESRTINNGAVLLSPAIERNQQRLIEEAMKAAPASVASDAGYIANAAAPTFDSLIQLVDKVRPLEAKVREQPAVLTIEVEATDPEG